VLGLAGKEAQLAQGACASARERREGCLAAFGVLRSDLEHRYALDAAVQAKRIFSLLVPYIPLAHNVNSTRVWLTAEATSR